MKKIGRIVRCIFFIWLACLVLTCLLIPLLQKSKPVRPFEGRTARENAERVACIDDNQEAMIRRLQLIESARKEIDLSTYYLGDDDAGRDIMAALLSAARRGVSVRVLVDGFCEYLDLRHSDCFYALADEPNVEIRVYNPVSILFPAKNNYRLHDKYLIADENTYILGGRNTRSKSIGDYPGKQDVDRDVLVTSPEGDGSILELKDYFKTVWSSRDSKPVKQGKSTAQGREVLEKRYEALKVQSPQAFEKIDLQALTIPAKSVHLLANPVNAGNKQPLLWTQLTELMKKGTDIEVVTPYIILNRQMYADLREIADHAQVKILTNAPESGANPSGCADLLNQKRRLLRTGLVLCEYAGEKSAHTKTVVIDDNLSIIGSFNFDMRSAYLDTELMLAIDCPELNQYLRQVNDQSIASSRITSPDGTVRFGENFDPPEMGFTKNLIYGILRVLTIPVRHLL